MTSQGTEVNLLQQNLETIPSRTRLPYTMIVFTYFKTFSWFTSVKLPLLVDLELILYDLLGKYFVCKHYLNVGWLNIWGK